MIVYVLYYYGEMINFGRLQTAAYHLPSSVRPPEYQPLHLLSPFLIPAVENPVLKPLSISERDGKTISAIPSRPPFFPFLLLSFISPRPLSPCERNWSTFSLIHTQKRNRLGYQRLQDLVFCHYNMRLREKLLRDENREPEDPLDLTTIGQYAYVEGNDDREDPLYEWVKNISVDEDDGMPAQRVANEARAQGVDVEEVVHKQTTPEESFDPLTRSQIGPSSQPSSSHRQTYGSSPTSSSKTDTDETRDDDDDGGQGGPGGGVYEGYGTESQQPLSPFTFEAQYTHATQDYDHGARSQSQTYTQRQKEKEPLDEASLRQSFAGFDLDISGTTPYSFYYPQSQYPYPFMYYDSMPQDNEAQQNITDEDYEEPARYSTWY